MKAPYILALAIVLSMPAKAQQISSEHADREMQKTNRNVSPLPLHMKSAGNAIWLEDFANGWPNGWTTQDPSGLCPWKWTTNGSHGFWNGNNNGADYDDPLNSTTAANGFLISDVDSANHFNFGQPSGTTYQYFDTRFTTTAIDLSANPGILLEFEQSFRMNNDVDLEVSVSNDSTNWTTWTVQGNTASNDVSDDPDLVQLNISAVAGGQSTVYIRIGWNSRVYFWMIDDMRIVEAPANDLRLLNNHFNEWDFGTSPNFSTLEFTNYPSSQVRPLPFRTVFENFGMDTQTGVTLSVDVTDDMSNNVFSGSSNSIDLAGNSIDSLYVNGYTPSGNTGRFTIDYNVAQDQMDESPVNNAGKRWFEVSDFIFARDTAALAGSYSNEGGAYEYGNWFNIQNNDEVLYGVDVVLDDSSIPGTIIYGAIYDGNRDLIEYTEEYELQTSDLNAFGGNQATTLVFDTPIDLIEGQNYLVMMGHYGGVDDVFIGTSGYSPAQSSLLYDAPLNEWFYVTTTPMVRMNFNPSVGLEDLAFQSGVRLGQNMPNPYNGNTRIAYEIDQAMNTSFEVHDITGKLVFTKQLGRMGPGIHQLTFSAVDFSPGVYYYSLQTEEHRITKKMIVSGN